MNWPLSVKVVVNGAKGKEVRPAVLTVMDWELVPVGTVTVREPAEAAVTGTRTEPNQTILAEGVALKLLPLIVTVVLTGPEAGVTEFMTGCANTGSGKRRATI
jgi:uncharacterized membrane protein